MKWLAIVLCLAVLVGCGTTHPGDAAIMRPRAEDGSIIRNISLFATYQPRGAVVGSVDYGTKVWLIQIDNNGALVQTIDGVRGWCNKAFVQQL